VNVLDLFSGIGGFSLGLERAGMRTIAFCERDEFCRAVLRKHWPDIPCFDDIHSIDSDGLGGLGPIDLICGGFPCQPFSAAGEKKGKDDDRYLWPQMLRIIALARPTWVLGENVAGIIPMALDDVLADLENLGYAARPFVIPACAVDAKHRRDRVWIIATDPARLRGIAIKRNEQDGTLQGNAVIPNAQRDQLRNESGRSGGTGGAGETELTDNGAPRSLADAIGERCSDNSGCSADAEFQGDRAANSRHRRYGEHTQWRFESAMGRMVNGIPAKLDRTQQRGVCWEPEPMNVPRIATGVHQRVKRLRSLGNAVVPQVVEEIGRAIMSESHAQG
jgi:DNA (cytosine-5)-methyltransferase 1